MSNEDERLHPFNFAAVDNRDMDPRKEKRLCDMNIKELEAEVRRYSEAGEAVAKELGYCGNCEKPLDECRCVWLAAASNK